jgi:hypothetical protein
MKSAKSICPAEMDPEDFRRQMKLNEFVIRYTPELCDIESEEYVFWKTHVVPSCVPDKKKSKLTCVFCGRQISTTSGIRRHYMEQHYAYIPEGIFGSKVFIECKQCDLKFSRNQHLASHLTSELHHKNLRLLDFQKEEDKKTFFTNCLFVEDCPKVENPGSPSVVESLNASKKLGDSGYLSLNSTLAYLNSNWSEELRADPNLPRSSTKLSSIFENFENASQPHEATNEVTGLNIEEEGENSKCCTAYSSVKNKSFPVYSREKKQKKKLDDKDLSDAFFQNLSFNLLN